MRFTGAYTALATPFSDGDIDEEAYRQFIEWQISEGIDGLVPCGSTGESATMSHEEHAKVIRICVDQAKKRVPVIAGAGSNNTAEAIHLTRIAREAGADAALLITPYYNKPTQDGLFAHYRKIADEVPEMPLIVYNVPGRTGVCINPATMARMFREIPSVTGMKEATADMTYVSEVLELCGPDLNLLSGDDFTVLPTLMLGGEGVISVTSNIAPRKMATLCAACAGGNLTRARKLHYELNPLNRACFVESNPIPVKTALAVMGKMKADLRLPLVQPSPENQNLIRRTLEAMGLAQKQQ
ncbi:MAG: 4-hydroxy-tetrahydrodipicolinate synthase [Desulfovibrio sp.]|jgi:4-hydroxy-tetrahydrodipicolinate synthase|nr:4-hydroxy-tetrahydrodipicolinate synthase [Desulfovibrio sp.]